MLKHQVKENKSLYHTPSGVFHIAKQYFIAKLFHKSEGFISLKNDTVKTVSFFWQITAILIKTSYRVLLHPLV